MQLETLRRKNFSPNEFFKSPTADKLKIDNVAKELATILNLAIGADKIQEIRNIVGRPVKITSGFRCFELNLAVGGQPTSYHLSGCAIDFIVPGFSKAQLRQLWGHLRDIAFDCDKCIFETKGDTFWIHLQYKADPSKNRNQFLEINKK